MNASSSGAPTSAGRAQLEAEVLRLPLYLRSLATLACLLIFTLGVCGNLLVPLVVAKTKYLRNSTNLFLINLSVADLLVLTVCMPTALIELHSRPETWLLGGPMCKITNFVEMLAANGSIFTILAISFERYYAICKPLKAGYKCTRLRAGIIICLIWLLASLLTSPILVIAKSSETIYIDGSIVNNCILETVTYWHKMYVFISMIAFFCFPLLVLMLVYWLIGRRLFRDHLAMSAGPEQTQMSQTAVTQSGSIHWPTLLSPIALLFSALKWVTRNGSHSHLNESDQMKSNASLAQHQTPQPQTAMAHRKLATGRPCNSNRIHRIADKKSLSMDEARGYAQITSSMLTSSSKSTAGQNGRLPCDYCKQSSDLISEMAKMGPAHSCFRQEGQIAIELNQEASFASRFLSNLFQTFRSSEKVKPDKKQKLRHTFIDSDENRDAHLSVHQSKIGNGHSRRVSLTDERGKLKDISRTKFYNKPSGIEFETGNGLGPEDQLSQSPFLKKTLNSHSHKLCLASDNSQASANKRHIYRSKFNWAKFSVSSSSASMQTNCTTLALELSMGQSSLSSSSAAQSNSMGCPPIFDSSSTREAIISNNHCKCIPSNESKKFSTDNQDIQSGTVNVMEVDEFHASRGSSTRANSPESTLFSSKSVSTDSAFQFEPCKQAIQPRLSQERPLREIDTDLGLEEVESDDSNENLDCQSRPDMKDGLPGYGKSSSEKLDVSAELDLSRMPFTFKECDSRRIFQPTMFKTMSPKTNSENCAHEFDVKPNGRPKPNRLNRSLTVDAKDECMHLNGFSNYHFPFSLKRSHKQCSQLSMCPQCQRGSQISEMAGQDLSKRQQMDSRRQVVMMLAFVVACFFISFFPYRVFTIWLILSTEDQVQSLGMEAYYNLTYFSRILIYLHSAINPIAYNLISTKFRRAFMSILLCRGASSRRHFTTDQRTVINRLHGHDHRQTVRRQISNINKGNQL